MKFKLHRWDLRTPYNVGQIEMRVQTVTLECYMVGIDPAARCNPPTYNPCRKHRPFPTLPRPPQPVSSLTYCLEEVRKINFSLFRCLLFTVVPSLLPMFALYSIPTSDGMWRHSSFWDSTKVAAESKVNLVRIAYLTS